MWLADGVFAGDEAVTIGKTNKFQITEKPIQARQSIAIQPMIVMNLFLFVFLLTGLIRSVLQ